MNYLLDTNIIIFALTNDPALPDEAKDIINDPRHEKYVSAASIWEIVIKHDKKPQIMPLRGSDVVKALNNYGINILPVNADHVLTVAELRTTDTHNDPFDRILIAQSKYENFIFITCDQKLDGYNEPTVKSLKKK